MNPRKRFLDPSEEEKAQWLQANATVHCAFYVNLRMKPDRCPLRIEKIRRNPVIVGQDIAWECSSCSGPVPLDSKDPVELPKLPQLSEHGSRMLRARMKSFRCIKCGETRIDEFDKGHSRQCRTCYKKYRAEKNIKKNESDRAKRAQNPHPVCVECGADVLNTGRSRKERIEASLCSTCWDARIAGKKIDPSKRISCKHCGKHINLGRNYSAERIKLALCGRCYQDHRRGVRHDDLENARPLFRAGRIHPSGT